MSIKESRLINKQYLLKLDSRHGRLVGVELVRISSGIPKYLSRATPGLAFGFSSLAETDRN
jgi:hypothetical protein